MCRNVSFFTGSSSKEFAKGGEFYCKSDAMRAKCIKGAMKADEALVSARGNSTCLRCNFDQFTQEIPGKDQNPCKIPVMDLKL